MKQIAFCRRCNQPLVSTFAFSRYEFYCLNCGSKYGYLEPLAADETPERLERMHAVERDWATVSDGLIAEGGIRTDCQQCQQPMVRSHMDHATEEERNAHEAAMLRINARAASWRPPRGHGWSGAPKPA